MQKTGQNHCNCRQQRTQPERHLKCSRTVRYKTGHGRARNLSDPEKQGDEAKGVYGPVRTGIITDLCRHNGWDTPHGQAEYDNRRIQERIGQIGVGQRL